MSVVHVVVPLDVAQEIAHLIAGDAFDLKACDRFLELVEWASQNPGEPDPSIAAAEAIHRESDGREYRVVWPDGEGPWERSVFAAFWQAREVAGLPDEFDRDTTKVEDRPLRQEKG